MEERAVRNNTGVISSVLRILRTISQPSIFGIITNEITGNPNLKPTDEYQFQTIYVLKSKYQLIGWFNYANNYFVQSPYQRHDRLAISYQSQHFHFQQQAGLQAIVPFKVSQWLDSRVTLTGIWQREKNNHFYDISFDRHIFFGI